MVTLPGEHSGTCVGEGQSGDASPSTASESDPLWSVRAFSPTGAADGPFPLHVSVRVDGLADAIGADVGRIKLQDEAGVELPRQVLSWQASDEHLDAWILLPRLQSVTEFSLELRRESESGVDSAASGSVWSEFEAVWHMDELTGEPAGVEDASGGPALLAASDGELVDGVIEGGLRVEAPGRLEAPSLLTDANAVTWAMWVKPTGPNQVIFEDGDGSTGVRLFVGASAWIFEWSATGNTASATRSYGISDRWYHVVVTLERQGATDRATIWGRWFCRGSRRRPTRRQFTGA